MSVHKWAFRRETGIRPKFGEENLIMRRLYHSLEPYRTWNDLSGVPTQSQVSEYGAVFNLEFSPGGNVLAAACERRSIVLFDAITQKQTHHIMEAHADNVNCVKFLDKCTFATCSDDTTVALWDLRNLKKKLRSLKGHSNWVKNIEYSSKNGLLVTSGFDGSIFTWDINAPTEDGLTYQKVFHTSGLMRCRIAPDCSKLVLCTTGGYLMIIHDLDLTTLHDDLCGFKPTIYRLMQMGNQYIPQAGKFDHIFSKKMKRNRVELISDFPENNDAEIVLALQIHPKGLSFLSRNISYNGESEWSCIHDINEEPYDITIPKAEKRKRRKRCKQHRNVRPKNDDDPFDMPSTSAGLEPTTPQIPHLNDNVPSTSAAAIGRMNTRSRTRANQAMSNNNNPNSNHNTSNGYSELNSNGPTTSHGASTSHAHMNGHGPNTANGTRTGQSRPSTSSRSEFIPDIWAAEISVQERYARQTAQQVNSVTGYDSVYAISSGILPMPLLDDETLNLSYSPDCPLNAGTNPWANKHILQNANKLLYYIKESNKGKGFIKEPCFSADGRIICSPYNTSVRLLSYEQDCSEHPNACERLKQNPKQLVEVKTIKCHSDIVLSTAFSPHQPLMVTGCKLGKVTWHYPNL